MADKSFSIKSDGNGGLDVNLQKTILKKYGPIIGFLFLALSGLGAKFGETAYDAITGHDTDAQAIQRNSDDILELKNNINGLRMEFREDLKGIRDSQTRIEDYLLNQKDDGNG